MPHSQPLVFHMPELGCINSRLATPTFVEEDVAVELDGEGVAELFSRNFLLMLTELNFFGWGAFVTVEDTGPPFEVGVVDVWGGVVVDGVSLSVVNSGVEALASSPVVSPVTGPASEDFVKSCLLVSIFAIYASQDASYRVFRVRSLCSSGCRS